MDTRTPDIDGTVGSHSNHAEPETEIGFRQILSLFAREKFSMLAITATFTLVAGAAAFLVPKKYEAVATVSPVTEKENTDKMSGLTSQLGGLAALAGISTSSGGKKSESIATLQSERLTERYIQENNLLPILYPRKWDSKLQRWKSPSDAPTLWKANRYFKDSVRRVTEDPKTAMVTVSITWKDPAMAAKWANDLVKLTNDYLRSKAISESERRIAYLTDQAVRADAIEIKSSIYTLLETEIKEQTLARGTDEYALKVVDPAFAPEKPSFPIPGLWIGLGVLSGLVTSLIFVLIRADWDGASSKRR